MVSPGLFFTWALLELVLTGHLVLRQKVLSGEAGAAGAGAG